MAGQFIYTAPEWADEQKEKEDTSEGVKQGGPGACCEAVCSTVSMAGSSDKEEEPLQWQ